MCYSVAVTKVKVMDGDVAVLTFAEHGEITLKPSDFGVEILDVYAPHVYFTHERAKLLDRGHQDHLTFFTKFGFADVDLSKWPTLAPVFKNVPVCPPRW